MECARLCSFANTVTPHWSHRVTVYSKKIYAYNMKYGQTDKMRATNEYNHFMGAICWFAAVALLIDHREQKLVWSSSSDNPKTVGIMVLCCVVEWAPRRVWGQKQILSIDFIFIGPCESLQIESIAYTKITLHHYSICGNVWLKQKKNCAINFLAWPRNRLKGQQQQQRK